MNSYCKMIESNKDLLVFGNEPNAKELERIEQEEFDRKFKEQDWELDLNIPSSRSTMQVSS